MIELVLVGAAGRMGQAVADVAGRDPAFEVKAFVDRPELVADRGAGWTASLDGAVSRGVVVIEFSSPAACVEAARLCAERGAALVSGTTGLGAAEEDAMRGAATRTAVLRAANFSLGIATLRRALAAALDAAPRGWDVEIVERHHRGKVDSPSGTALALAQDVARRRGWDGRAFRNGREGRVGPRPEAEIGLHSVRGGTWVGDHEVLLAGEDEWIELRHVTSTRGAFAHGAVAAARFVATAAPGLYTLEHCLGSSHPA